ncbi:MAG: hypothetical protein L6R48_13725 [Planctomycetes bacterium]|nr:hypothetical protein [Planctomycetota bacterium]
MARKVPGIKKAGQAVKDSMHGLLDEDRAPLLVKPAPPRVSFRHVTVPGGLKRHYALKLMLSAALRPR